ncbi:hypothetical protein [Mesorhizobium sp. M1B.F.Ca.ET.045.04.1.1]|uniref:hypothetical protein n=1 Tax=Mesorhizobium sp. M1B.F.Ca.ET.045.04.1.1 TaxID=2493673 RepID=UPI000F763EA2|nr:hypothetical protein [Mesorhizobium sp. M1B.F.Ca.ET.045.04.1.1]AZO29332.1 hypothetical protein EJ071_19395 [Mesorhizobium sp. M1B.F.Ca.ET.045.04.1.1]
MSYPVTVWLVITVILGLVATFAIWARGFSRARGLAVLAFLLASPIAAASLGFSLGWPVPLVDGLTLSAGEHAILGAKITIGDGIYVLIDRGEEQPRYFKIPWDPKMADKLQQALDEKGEGGEAGITVDQFRWPWEKKGKNGGGQGGEKRAQEGNPSVEMNPFEWSWDTHEKRFWAKPQPKVLPDKRSPPPAPTYEQQI